MQIKFLAQRLGSGEILASEVSLGTGGELKLGNWKDDNTLIINNQIVKAFSGLTKINEEYTDVINQKKYYVDSPFKVFKTTVFKCTNIEYVEGRVHQIEFEIK